MSKLPSSPIMRGRSIVARVYMSSRDSQLSAELPVTKQKVDGLFTREDFAFSPIHCVNLSEDPLVLHEE